MFQKEGNDDDNSENRALNESTLENAKKEKNLLKYKWSNYSYKLLNKWQLTDLDLDSDQQAREEVKEFDMSVYSQYI